MRVVKLGGSLLGAPALRRWLDLLARSAGPLAIVPGGGPFADAVRRLQPRLGFGDLAAHRMAILAMQQNALRLHELEPRLRLAETEAELGTASPCLWLPWRLAGRAADLPASWDVTSDSLAAWLAARLGARALLLVKSGRVPEGKRSAAELAGAGLVDPAFPSLARGFAGDILVVHRDRLPVALEPEHLDGCCRVSGGDQEGPAAASSSAGSSASSTARATR